MSLSQADSPSARRTPAVNSTLVPKSGTRISTAPRRQPSASGAESGTVYPGMSHLLRSFSLEPCQARAQSELVFLAANETA